MDPEDAGTGRFSTRPSVDAAELGAGDVDGAVLPDAGSLVPTGAVCAASASS